MTAAAHGRPPCFRCVSKARAEVQDGTVVIGTCTHARVAFAVGGLGVIGVDVDEPKDAPRATRWLERHAPRLFAELEAQMDTGDEGNAGDFYANPVRVL